MALNLPSIIAGVSIVDARLIPISMNYLLNKLLMACGPCALSLLEAYILLGMLFFFTFFK